MTDSSTSGFLQPTDIPGPLEGTALANFFQALVVGITGMPATSVMPRWQSEPPNIPAGDWCAIGIVSRVADTYAAEVHLSDSDTQIQRHEVLRILTSFYGTDADSWAQIFREGLQLAQNREILTLNGMGLIDSEDTVAVPSIIKERWLYRVDMAFSIKRQIIRTYNIRDLASWQGTLETDVPPLTETL